MTRSSLDRCFVKRSAGFTSPPYTLGFKVPELFCSGCTHQCRDERLSCHGVHITLDLLHHVQFIRGLAVHLLPTLVLEHQVGLHITMYPVDASGELLVDHELRAEALQDGSAQSEWVDSSGLGTAAGACGMPTSHCA